MLIVGIQWINDSPISALKRRFSRNVYIVLEIRTMKPLDEKVCQINIDSTNRAPVHSCFRMDWRFFHIYFPAK